VDKLNTIIVLLYKGRSSNPHQKWWESITMLGRQKVLVDSPSLVLGVR